MIDILLEGFRSTIFGLILLGSWGIPSLACWAIKAWEQKYWARQRSVDTLPYFADPPPWR